MSTHDFSTLVARHRTYFRTGATRSAEWREGQLRALRAMMATADLGSMLTACRPTRPGSAGRRQWWVPRPWRPRPRSAARAGSILPPPDVKPQRLVLQGKGKGKGRSSTRGFFGEVGSMLVTRSTPVTGPTRGGGLESSRPPGPEHDRLGGEESLATVAREPHNAIATNLFALEALADGRDGDPATRRARRIVKRQDRRRAGRCSTGLANRLPHQRRFDPTRRRPVVVRECPPAPFSALTPSRNLPPGTPSVQHSRRRVRPHRLGTAVAFCDAEINLDFRS